VGGQEEKKITITPTISKKNDNVPEGKKRPWGKKGADQFEKEGEPILNTQKA